MSKIQQQQHFNQKIVISNAMNTKLIQGRRCFSTSTTVRYGKTRPQMNTSHKL